MLKFSNLLSLMSAWETVQSLLMTLMKSKTTRRSAPRWMSRLRRPMSKSITQTVLEGFLAAIHMAKMWGEGVWRVWG